MATKIAWTDETWNPTVGCTKVSEGCQNCYAERMAYRLSAMGIPRYDMVQSEGMWNGNIELNTDALDKPLHWKKPRMIFVDSMSDLFHPNVPFEFVDKVFVNMFAAPRHTYQILTKRPNRVLEYVNRLRSVKFYNHKRIWLGVSVENQKRADERIPILLQIPAAVRFVSIEPMLGEIDLNKKELICKTWRKGLTIGTYLDWVIIGGESGPGARPMHPDWVRGVRDQCIAAGVPFFFKQWGEWAPYDRGGINSNALATPKSLDRPLQRFGKKKAGRLLDGKEWNEYPIKKGGGNG